MKFRTCNHKFPIEIGRYSNTPRQERFCKLCDQICIGDEFHYMLECSKVKPLRTKYLSSVYTARPNVLKFANLLGSDNYRTLISLPIFFEHLYYTLGCIVVQILNIISLMWFCSKLSDYFMYVRVYLLFKINCRPTWNHNTFHHDLPTL